MLADDATGEVVPKLNVQVRADKDYVIQRYPEKSYELREGGRLRCEDSFLPQGELTANHVSKLWM